MEWVTKNKGYSILILVTVIWVSGAVVLLVPEYIKKDFTPEGMPLNELGDYLAGAFSPLAFLWLVYGYFMQNSELKSQLKEYKESVRLTQENLNLQKEIFEKGQLDKFLRNQPKFWDPSCKPYKSKSNLTLCVLQIANLGAKAFKVQLTLENGLPASNIVGECIKGNFFEIKTNIPYHRSEGENEKYWLTYIDYEGSGRQAELHVSWIFKNTEGLCIPYPLITMPENPTDFSLVFPDEQ